MNMVWRLVSGSRHSRSQRLSGWPSGSRVVREIDFENISLTTHRGSQTGKTLPFPEGIQGALPN